jgi:uncharacterized glyoxalase superfamily protein PhnB
VTYPQLCPYLYYENGAEAMDWLAKAFGFRERMRVAEDDGTIRHAEMELGDAVIMLGTPPGHKSPAHLGQVTVGMYVRVDDVDAHYQHAKAAGAEVENEPTNQDYGDRSYGVRDLEGHQWWFYTPVS